MHLDLAVVLAGLIVGFAVGLTGMGGGALMTPVLVLLLHVQPTAAVSSDLVASVVMKPVAGAVHLRRRTVCGPVVWWLAAGAVPAAFAGAALLHLATAGPTLEGDVKLGLGAALCLAVAGIVAKILAGPPAAAAGPPAVRPVPTLVVGAVGGLVVGMTSVGSGSLMLVALMFLYPTLTGAELVGTDLVQSIPLVAAAACGQALFGGVHLGLTVSLLVGSVPASYLGARLSARAQGAWLRPAIAVVLLLSALKLLAVPNLWLAVAGGAAAVGVSAAAVAARRRAAPGYRRLAPAS